MTKDVGFSERMRSRRIEMGISQRELGRDTGISPPQLSRYEGGSTPRPDIAAKIAKALGVTYEWLAYGGESPPDPVKSPIRAILAPHDSNSPHQLRLELDTTTTAKMIAIADFEKSNVYLSAMDLIYDAIDKRYAEIKSQQKPINLANTVDENKIQELIAKSMLDPKFQEQLATITLINKVLSDLTPVQIIEFDKKFLNKHGEDPNDRSAYFRELIEFAKNKTN